MIGNDITVLGGSVSHSLALHTKLPNVYDPAYHRQNDLCNTARRMLGLMNPSDEAHLVVAMSSDARELLTRLTDLFVTNGYKLSAQDDSDLRHAVQAIQQVQQ